jgi:beta-xylosidase
MMARRGTIGAVLFVFVAFMLILIPSTSAYLAGAKSYVNPVLGDGLAADPHVFVDKASRQYVATATGGTTRHKFRIWTSPDLVTWTHVGFIFPEGSWPKWAAAGPEGFHWWAPEIQRILGKYYAFYSISCGALYPMCIGVATAPKATGPWKDSGKPLIRRAKVMNLDATVAYDHAKKQHLVVWKRYGVGAVIRGSQINAQPLSRNLLSVKAKSKPKVILPLSLRWESNVVEGPHIFYRKGYYYLFYAANHYKSPTCDYVIGVARSKNIMGPYTKRKSPMVHKSNRWCNPGAPNVVSVLGKSKRTALLFHATIVGHDLVARSLLMDELRWNKGWPFVAGNIPSSTPRPVPR